MGDAHHCSGPPVSEMTYTVSSGTLNPTIPYLCVYTGGCTGWISWFRIYVPSLCSHHQHDAGALVRRQLPALLRLRSGSPLQRHAQRNRKYRRCGTAEGAWPRKGQRRSQLPAETDESRDVIASYRHLATDYLARLFTASLYLSHETELYVFDRLFHDFLTLRFLDVR